jgi:hypothetical protein
MNLDHFLRRKPQPAAVIADGQRIEPNGGGRQWRDMVKTIIALDPRKITCVDAKGTILRVHDFGADVAEDDDDDAKPADDKGGGSQIETFARLIASAYEKGNTASQPLVHTAMEMVQSLSAQLGKAQAEIERLRAHNAKLTLQVGELSMLPADDDGGGVIGALVQGMAAAQQQKPMKPPVRAVPDAKS